MAPMAFAVSPTLTTSTFSRRGQSLVRPTPRRCAHQRRIRITNQSLYPDPDSPEPIPNPLDQKWRQGKREDSNEPFLKRLNDRTARRKATDTSAKALDGEATGNEPTPPVVPDAVKYVTAPLAPEQPQYPESNYRGAAMALWRIGWVSWWIQLILSVISGVILLFSFAFPGVNVRTSASAVGFVLSAVGVFIAFISLFWTYSYTRLSLWLERATCTAEQARSKINGRLRLGVWFSIAGLLVSLLGLQAIVGTLLARLFGAGIATTPYTAYQAGPAGPAGGLLPGAGIVQPVDILIVQACANAMMALLTALLATIWLRSREKAWNKKAKMQ